MSSKAPIALVLALLLGVPAGHARVPVDGPALRGDRITQAEITSGLLPECKIRRAGLKIFSTPFNKHDGFGDGPMKPSDPVAPGGRPTISGNGTWLRLNGLDSQTCLECHSVLTNAEIPARFAVGGVGGMSASAFPKLTEFDIADGDASGVAEINGRAINPPFIFGAGGVELAAKEMTADLQALKAEAEALPGTVVALDTKGVHFGSISYDALSRTFDTSNVEGIDDDLVVRPFGRKGDNSSIRAFDVGAMQFHHGMQPVEEVGAGVDGDGDGVVDEILVGEISALHIFSVSLERPRQLGGGRPLVREGFEAFLDAGCGDCHVPALETESKLLGLAFPEVETDPAANVFYTVDLVNGSAGFEPNDQGGVSVPLFSDLKRHDMGEELAETTGEPLDPWFITPRLWGIADTAPYLHDGRALTLRGAIELHGGEGQLAADHFAAMPSHTQGALITFLRSLRTPRNPSEDLLRQRCSGESAASR